MTIDATDPRREAAALATSCSVLMAAASGLGTALNAHDLGWWNLLGVAIALSFVANLKGVLHPVLRVLAVLGQLALGAMILFSLPVLIMAESGAPLPWWVWPLAMALLVCCAVAIVAGVRTLRRERNSMVRTIHSRDDG
jgi:4-hydroxybenzoate polyprenyltransferase